MFRDAGLKKTMSSGLSVMSIPNYYLGSKAKIFKVRYFVSLRYVQYLLIKVRSMMPTIHEKKKLFLYTIHHRHKNKAFL